MVEQAKIHRRSISINVEDRREAVRQFRDNFPALPDKNAAWQDLIRLTGDEDLFVKNRAADALGSSFSNVPNKDGAWEDLHRLTCDEDRLVRMGATNALPVAFPHIPDKNGAWQDLHRLTRDEDSNVRFVAAEALGSAFANIPYKEGAWQDLHRLTGDNKSEVRWSAASAVGTAFPHVPDKEGAWQDLIGLTGDRDSLVRWMAASALGTYFFTVPNKYRAWQDLYRLTRDEDCFVRMGAVSSLGSAFSTVPDKDTAWDAMIDLSEAHERDVRMFANHSLGKASIFKATEAEGEEDLRQELEKALEYFEKSAAVAEYSNPAEFCLPFYRSFHIIAFKETYSETELNGYLNEAKNVAEGSKNRAKLLEIIEHISQAQKEAQSAQEMNLDSMKCYLNIYRKNCEPASDLLCSAEEIAPIAAKLIRRRIPIIDQGIRETIKAVLDAVEAKHVPESELQGTLDAMQQTLSEIQQQNVGLQEALKCDVERSRKVINDPELGVSDKLKLTIPIIPYILSYERVIELKSGVNLSAAWDRLVGLAKGKK